MNRTPDVELVMRDYFADDGLTAPDRVLEVVEERISRLPRRPTWRLPRRSSPMNRTLSYAAALAAVIVVAVVGYAVLSRQGPVGTSTGAPPTPTAQATAPGPAATAAIQPLSPGALTAGRYRMLPFPGLSGLTAEVTVPAGWSGFPGQAILGPNGTGAPAGVGFGILAPEGLFADPCHWDAIGNGAWPQAGTIAVGGSPVEIADALVASDAYQATRLADTTLAGFAAERVDIQLPADDFSKCDNVAGMTSGAYWLWGTRVPDGSDIYAQGPANRWHVWLVDADGRAVAVLYNDYAATPQADQDAALAILNSIVIREP
jgi:hypothetical protein